MFSFTISFTVVVIIMTLFNSTFLVHRFQCISAFRFTERHIKCECLMFASCLQDYMSIIHNYLHNCMNTIVTNVLLNWHVMRDNWLWNDYVYYVVKVNTVYDLGAWMYKNFPRHTSRKSKELKKTREVFTAVNVKMYKKQMYWKFSIQTVNIIIINSTCKQEINITVQSQYPRLIFYKFYWMGSLRLHRAFQKPSQQNHLTFNT